MPALCTSLSPSRVRWGLQKPRAARDLGPGGPPSQQTQGPHVPIYLLLGVIRLLPGAAVKRGHCPRGLKGLRDGDGWVEFYINRNGPSHMPGKGDPVSLTEDFLSSHRPPQGQPVLGARDRKYSEEDRR